MAPNDNEDKPSLKSHMMIIFTIANIIIAAFNVGVAYYNFNLNTQAYFLNTESMSIEHFNSTIIVNPNYIDLGSPSSWLSSNGVITETTHHGYLEATIQVITPHYSKIEVKIKDFQVRDTEYLSQSRGNESSVEFASSNNTYEYIVNKGINSIDTKILLKGTLYPDSTKLSINKVGIPFGYITFGVVLTDLQTQTITNQAEFSELVFAFLSAEKQTG